MKWASGTTKEIKFVPNSLRYILTCPTYKGTLVANNYEIEKGKMIATETVVKDENAILPSLMWKHGKRHNHSGT
jgi:hypothetical protein